jgi:DNA-directed RNA polymerase subunit N (RpoN/RPB10)
MATCGESVKKGRRESSKQMVVEVKGGDEQARASFGVSRHCCRVRPDDESTGEF